MFFAVWGWGYLFLFFFVLTWKKVLHKDWWFVITLKVLCIVCGKCSLVVRGSGDAHQDFLNNLVRLKMGQTPQWKNEHHFPKIKGWFFGQTNSTPKCTRENGFLTTVVTQIWVQFAEKSKAALVSCNEGDTQQIQEQEQLKKFQTVPLSRDWISTGRLENIRKTLSSSEFHQLLRGRQSALLLNEDQQELCDCIYLNVILSLCKRPNLAWLYQEGVSQTCPWRPEQSWRFHLEME